MRLLLAGSAKKIYGCSKCQKSAKMLMVGKS
uniref:Uncharacterized protein n=1 Tax=Rhizophora mucronata TaxID=61149 RepID=A0A2P2QM54_RHIMU